MTAGDRRPAGGTDEDALDELRRVQSVTEAALAYLTVDDLLPELLTRVLEAIETDTAAILLLDETGSELVARAAKGLEEEIERGVRIPVGRGFAGRIAAEAKPVIIEEVDPTNVLNPILREKGIRSLLGVPLIIQGRTIGVLHVGTLAPRAFNDADVHLLQLVADRVALAVHAGLYERERLVAATLQRSLLPDQMPIVSGLDFAVRYMPGGGGEVGGDWYDAFSLSSGDVAIVVGDVVGRGLRAAAVMGRVRNTLRAYAFEGLAPSDAVERLNALLYIHDPGEMATLIFGVIDVESRMLRFVNAGHLPPVIVPPGGDGYFVESDPQPPIGAVRSFGWRQETVQLMSGSKCVFYTDGLVERRDQSLDSRLERLRQIVASEGAVEGVTKRLVAELAAEVPSDDVAIIAFAFSAPDRTPLTIRVRAEPSELAAIRRTMRTWLADAGVSPELIYDVLVATGEACANAIEHAYGLEEGSIDVSMARGPESLTVSVRDAGQWRVARGRDRGRGLPLMRALASSVEVVRDTSGTEIRLGWRLTQDAGA